MLLHVALAFVLGYAIARGGDLSKGSSAQLALAVAGGFVLAALFARARGAEWYDRFPSPLVSPGPEASHVLIGEQGRDFIPYRVAPTAPPGPAVPAMDDPLEGAFESVPPVPTASPRPAAVSTVPRPFNSAVPVKAPAAAPKPAATAAPKSAATAAPRALYTMAETDELDM